MGVFRCLTADWDVSLSAVDGGVSLSAVDGGVLLSDC